MVVDPPLLLIQEIQRLIVDFFWSGQHWLRAAALIFQSKKEDKDQ